MHDEPRSVPNSGRARQILASCLVAALTLHAGMIQGWQSPMSLKLSQKDSPVETLTDEQISNLATFPNILGLVAALMSSVISQRCGRKVNLILTGVFSTAGGVILTFATNTIHLYVGRCFMSFAGIGVSVVPMYISETVHESLRGTLMVMCTFQLNVGILLSYTAGAKLSYKVFNSLFIILPVVYTILIFFLPETPLFLAEKDRLVDAIKSMTWFRGGDHHLAEQEIERYVSSKKDERKLTFTEIVKSKVSRYAIVTSVMLYSFQVLSGIFAILNFAGMVFKKSGDFMSPDDSSIVIACVLLGSSGVNMLLMDKLGRKPLLYVSFAGSALGMTGLGIYLYVKMKDANVDQPWIPLASLAVFVFCYGVGLASVPGALTNEISPTNIKPAVGATVMIVAFVLMMVVIKSFLYMDDYLGLYSVFVIPSVANILGIFYTVFFVPETKGKSMTEIQEELKNL